MATTSVIRLYQFNTKASPVPADIVYLGDSANAFDEVQSTIAQLISAYANLINLGQMSADIDLGSHKLINVSDPTLPQDAANKVYVDTFDNITLPSKIQNQGYNYVVDTGSANAVLLTLVNALTAYSDGQLISFRAAANNSGATTVNINGLGTRPIVTNGNVALSGGEILINGSYMIMYNSSYSAFVLK